MHAHRDVINVRHNQSESLGCYGDLPYRTEYAIEYNRACGTSGKLRGIPIDSKHGFPSQDDHDAGAKVHQFDNTNA